MSGEERAKSTWTPFSGLRQYDYEWHVGRDGGENNEKVELASIPKVRRRKEKFAISALDLISFHTFSRMICGNAGASSEVSFSSSFFHESLHLNHINNINSTRLARSIAKV